MAYRLEDAMVAWRDARLDVERAVELATQTALKLASSAHLRPVGRRQVRTVVHWLTLSHMLRTWRFGMRGRVDVVEPPHGATIADVHIYLPPYCLWRLQLQPMDPARLVSLILHEVAHLCRTGGALDEVFQVSGACDDPPAAACQHGPGWRRAFTTLVGFASGHPLPAEVTDLDHQALERAAAAHLHHHGWSYRGLAEVRMKASDRKASDRDRVDPKLMAQTTVEDMVGCLVVTPCLLGVSWLLMALLGGGG